LSAAIRTATASAPSLLNPNRLISPCCAGSRNTRGRGFPGCAFAVTVPASINPNPNAAQAGSATAFLSNPAASPTGFGNFNPNTSRGFFKKAQELIGSVFSRVFGAEFFAELQEFLAAFAGMFGPMRAHAEGVRTLLKSKEAAFLLVTSPDQAALEDARYFRDRIKSMGLPFAGFVLNRSWVRTDGLISPEHLELTDHAKVPGVHEAIRKLGGLAAVELARVQRDRELLAQLVAEVPSTAFAVATPYLGEAIEEVRERLGLRPGSRVELTEVEGHLEISPAATPARLVDHDGVLAAVTDTDLPVLTAEQVRDAVEATRR
jgi:hypothetical protein